MALHSRIKRINEELRSIVAEVIGHEIKDPRLTEAMVTVTQVFTAKDLSSAQVLVSVLGDDAKSAEVIKALTHSQGFIRHAVAERVTFRHVPEMSFKLDETERRAARIHTLLSQIGPTGPDAPEEPDERDKQGQEQGHGREDDLAETRETPPSRPA